MSPSQQPPVPASLRSARIILPGLCLLILLPLLTVPAPAAAAWRDHPLLQPYQVDGQVLPDRLFLVRSPATLPEVAGLTVHGTHKDCFLVSGEPDLVQGLARLGCLVMEVPAALPAATAVVQEWTPVVEPDPEIAAMVAQVEWTGVLDKVQTLVDHGTRYSYAPNHREVAQSLVDEFAALGLAAKLSPYTFGYEAWWNVEATQVGTLYPDSYLIICCHFDSISEDPLNLAPGADDNATGVAAVLTAAEILSQHEFEYSIRYLCFSGEEQGLVGSFPYAYYARWFKTDLVGVLNFDMLGYWEPGVEQDLEIETNVDSQWLARAVLNAADLYTDTVYELHVDDFAWWGDHYPFWFYGFPAVNHEEAWDWFDPDFNPRYHQTTDLPQYLDPGFTTGNIRVAVAALATLARAEPPRPIAFDLRPGSDPDSFNPLGQGTVTAVVPGSAELDAAQLVASSARLEGVLPALKTHVADRVTAVVADGRIEIGDGADGYADLWLEFAAADIAALVPTAVKDETVTLRLRVRHGDGSVFEGEDTLLITGAGGHGVAAKLAPDSGPLPAGAVVLHQNAPNPFNPATSIRLEVPSGAGAVTLRVYDLTGKLVRTLLDGVRLEGPQTVAWDGRDGAGGAVASGTYLYRATGRGFALTRKMVLQK